MTKVRNIKGTADHSCKCASWISHWEKHSKTKATICAEINCKSKEVIGAHIQKIDCKSNEWHIIPLCAAHNNSTEELHIGKTTLVSANITITCCNN